MSSPKPTSEQIQKLKDQYGDVFQVEFGELGWFVLLAWGKGTYGEYIDAALKDQANAHQRFAARSVLYPSSSDYALARARKPNLPKTIASLLCERAGIPRGEGSLADLWEEKLDGATPPASLERAGLSQEKAAELIAKASREQSVVSLSDRTGKVIFGGVIAAPTDVESGMVNDLKKRKKGVQLGVKEIVASCLVWSRDDFEQTVDTHPAVPTVLLESIADQLEVVDLQIFHS